MLGSCETINASNGTPENTSQDRVSQQALYVLSRTSPVSQVFQEPATPNAIKTVLALSVPIVAAALLLLPAAASLFEYRISPVWSFFHRVRFLPGILK